MGVVVNLILLKDNKLSDHTYEMKKILCPMDIGYKNMHEEDVDVFDTYNKESFKMCVMIFCTINDSSTYENLFKYNS
ncbi:hypothetical protein CR513_03296, partial [Mucuna pruriens]